MSDAITSIRQRLAEFQASPLGFGVSLRHDVARLIVDRLETLQWQQKDLAQALNKPESFVSRLIHRNANCTLETVGEVFHALGIKPHFVAREVAMQTEPLVKYVHTFYAHRGNHGQEEVIQAATVDLGSEETASTTTADDVWRQT